MRQDVANLRDSYYDAYDAYDANVRGSACHASHSASDHHGGCSRTGGRSRGDFDAENRGVPLP